MTAMTECDLHISEEAGVRYLNFGDNAIQGAMRIARPWSPELTYIREMLTALILLPEPPRHCLLIGLGSGALVKYLYRWFPETQLTVIEIDPRVIIMAEQFFKLPTSPRLELIVADAGEWMATAPPQSFDLLFLDGFDAEGLPQTLDTLSFYQDCQRSLNSSQGIFSCNLFSHCPQALASSHKQISQAFNGRSLLFPPCESGNTLCFAAVGAPIKLPLETLQQRTEHLKITTRLNLHPTLKRLKASTALSEQYLSL